MKLEEVKQLQEIRTTLSSHAQQPIAFIESDPMPQLQENLGKEGDLSST